MRFGEIKPGQLIHMKSFTDVVGTTKLTYKAGKGKLYMFQLMGITDEKTQSQLNPFEALEALGYQPIEEHKEWFEEQKNNWKKQC